jgi:hypothetical protein
LAVRNPYPRSSAEKVGCESDPDTLNKALRGTGTPVTPEGASTGR